MCEIPASVGIQPLTIRSFAFISWAFVGSEVVPDNDDNRVRIGVMGLRKQVTNLIVGVLARSRFVADTRQVETGPRRTTQPLDSYTPNTAEHPTAATTATFSLGLRDPFFDPGTAPSDSKDQLDTSVCRQQTGVAL